MKKERLLILAIGVILLAFTNALQAQDPMGTAFTYQGYLQKEGAPLHDTADFQFTLWDWWDISGSQVGSLVQVNDVDVETGLFTVVLDFGEDAFAGEARWLQIAVRSPAGSGVFTTLDPRQELTPAPYAVYAETAGSVLPGGSDDGDWTIVGSDMHSAVAGKVGIGTTSPDAMLSVIGKVRGAHDATEADYLEVGHGGSNGYINWAGSGNLAIRYDTASTLVTIDPNGKVGIGEEVPTCPLHIVESASGNTVLLEGGVDGVNPNISFKEQQGATANIRLRESNGDALEIQTGVGTAVTIQQDGNVGIGTTSPDELLTLAGVVSTGEAPTLQVKSYNPDWAGAATLRLVKSSGTSIGADVETEDGDQLGLIDVFGYNNINSSAKACRIAFIQDGPAGDYVPGQIRFSTSSGDSQSTTRMTIDKDGQVGVGNTTQPNDLLEVTGCNASGITLTGEAGAGAPFLTINNPDNGEASVLSARDTRAFDLEYPAGTYLLTIAQNGQVGIGTTSPDARLDVLGSEQRAGYFRTDYPSHTTEVVRAEYTGTGNYHATAVYGHSIPADGYGRGGYFIGGDEGVLGWADGTINKDYKGVRGVATGGTGITSAKAGVAGEASGPGTNYGVYGEASGGSTNHAGHFVGDVHVIGDVYKSICHFKIDHPLDPANKYLIHSSIESPDLKNMYDGVVTLDSKGEAWVQLPAWFEALNHNFRYQLTCVGGFAPVYIAEKISNNRFKIAGGKSSMEISWQITGIRQDAYAKANCQQDYRYCHRSTCCMNHRWSPTRRM